MSDNGKGDWYRHVDKKRYDEGYEVAFGLKKAKENCENETENTQVRDED
jgi:hypothetical protein